MQDEKFDWRHSARAVLLVVALLVHNIFSLPRVTLAHNLKFRKVNIALRVKLRLERNTTAPVPGPPSQLNLPKDRGPLKETLLITAVGVAILAGAGAYTVFLHLASLLGVSQWTTRRIHAVGVFFFGHNVLPLIVLLTSAVLRKHVSCTFPYKTQYFFLLQCFRAGRVRSPARQSSGLQKPPWPYFFLKGKGIP